MGRRTNLSFNVIAAAYSLSMKTHIVLLCACLLMGNFCHELRAESVSKNIQMKGTNLTDEINLNCGGGINWTGTLHLEKEQNSTWIVAGGAVTNGWKDDSFYAIYIAVEDDKGQLVACMQQSNFPRFPLKAGSSIQGTSRAAVSDAALRSIVKVKVTGMFLQ